MKRSLIVFIIAGLVLISSGLWFFTSFKSFNPMDLLHFGVIILVMAVTFAITWLILNFRGVRSE